MTTDGFVPLRVRTVVRDTDDSVVVEFDTAEPVPFRHGQHLTLRRRFDDVEVRRSYSICSPAPHGPLCIAVKRVDGGTFSNWVVDTLSAGDRLEALAPSGHFTHELDATAARRYTLLAGGSGITPVLSVAATVLKAEPRSSVDLLYVNRSTAATMLLEPLEDLRDRHLGRLRIAYLFTREPTPSPLLTGRPDRRRFDALVAAGLFPAGADHTFLCGPADLVDEARIALVDAGTMPERIHREHFTSAQLGVAPRPPARRVDATMVPVASGHATLHGRTTDVSCYDGDTVLEAVERVRPDVPYACRSGVCTTCQARLVRGTVTMAVNHGLDAADLARGLVLTCQAVPTTPDVAVDYDV